MTLNFKDMNQKELREYVLAHRDDNEAFYAYVDKVNAQRNRTKHAPLKSINDLENYPEFIEKLRQDSGRQV